MAKLTLTTDDGEVLGIWNVTTQETDARAFRLQTPFARTALIEEVRDELQAHERVIKECDYHGNGMEVDL